MLIIIESFDGNPLLDIWTTLDRILVRSASQATRPALSSVRHAKAIIKLLQVSMRHQQVGGIRRAILPWPMAEQWTLVVRIIQVGNLLQDTARDKVLPVRLRPIKAHETNAVSFRYLKAIVEVRRFPEQLLHSIVEAVIWDACIDFLGMAL